MIKKDIENRFDFHPATDEAAKERHELIRTHCKKLAFFINDLLPEGREKSTAITKLEEVMFWANAGIAREEEVNGK